MSDAQELLLDSDSFPSKRYEALSVIGQGAAGVVYLCRDRMLGGKKVAIKCLRAITADQLVSFQREAKATSLLTHPGVVAVLDFGSSENGAPYMVMEYVNGSSLEQVLNEKGAFNYRDAVPLFVKIAEALAYAHSKEIYHRDLKSSNILLVDAGEKTPDVRIIDFGVASVKQATQEPTIHQGRTIVGTPTYMSPDQAKNLPFDARSEIYALGCVMFETLTGRVPFVAETALEVIAMHAHEPPPAISSVRSDIQFPTRVETIIATCLAKDPDGRYQSMNALLEALNSDVADLQPAVAVSAPKNVTRVKPLAVAAVALAVVFTGLLSYQVKHQSDLDQAELKRKIEREEEAKAILKAEKELETIFSVNPNSKVWRARAPVTDAHLQALAKFKRSEVDLLELGSPNSSIKQELIGKAGWTAVGKLHLTQLIVPNCALDDEGMRQVAKIEEIKRLDITGNPVTDKGIAYLKNHKMTYLVATRTNISDESTKTIATLHELHDLIIAETSITDAGLKNLEHLSVTKISVSSMPITDEGLASIGRMPNLNELYLERTSVTLSGLKHLSRLKLIALDVNNIKNFNDDCMKYVAKTWTELRSFDINDVGLSDVGLAALSDMQSLRRLDVSDQGLSDAQLEYIMPLKNLTELVLNINKVTDKGVAKLVAALPNLKLIELTHTKVTEQLVSSLRKKGLNVQCYSVDGEGQSKTDVMELLDERLEETGDMFGGADL